MCAEGAVRRRCVADSFFLFFFQTQVGTPTPAQLLERRTHAYTQITHKDTPVTPSSATSQRITSQMFAMISQACARISTGKQYAHPDDSEGERESARARARIPPRHSWDFKFESHSKFQNGLLETLSSCSKNFKTVGRSTLSTIFITPGIFPVFSHGLQVLVVQ